MLTIDSRIKDLYSNTVGHDIIAKLLMQTGMSESIINNVVVRNLKLSTLIKLSKGKLNEQFAADFLGLMNSESDVPFMYKGEITKKWWKEAVFYQIYPRTFMDSNGDGVGDLPGITSKLDYLKELGVDAIWLSPIYDSPNDDNGYDIRDYRKIMTEFGTMADFDRLLEGAHERGMRIIMDLVVNHTSDEHEWFQKGLADPNSKYRNYYMIRNAEDPEKAPNNWTSLFSGPAWNYYEKEKAWALHLFSKKQMDLNWENDDLRHDVIDMINWWLDKGVDGFRMDVINFISKQEGLPDGNDLIASMMGMCGIEKYFYGPRLHEYLRQIRKEAFDPHEAFSVGETPGLGMKMCKLVTGEERKELDMVFNFDQLETPGHTRFDDYEYDLNYYRDYIIDWMENYGKNCRMALFFNNHDNPRMISKITKDKSLHTPLSKLLVLMQMTLLGTPFIFQGDEMGLGNYEFESIDQITDVESRNLYEELCLKVSAAEAMNVIAAGTREHARLLLPWNTTQIPEHEGLTQEVKPEVLEFFKKIIALRKSDLTFAYGDFFCISKRKDKFVYKRSYEGREYIIDCNLSGKPQKAYNVGMVWELILSTGGESDMLEPYEARIYKLS